MVNMNIRSKEPRLADVLADAMKTQEDAPMSRTGRDLQSFAQQMSELENERDELQVQLANANARIDVLNEQISGLKAELERSRRDANYHRERNVGLIETYKAFRSAVVGGMASTFGNMDDTIRSMYPKAAPQLEIEEEISGVIEQRIAQLGYKKTGADTEQRDD